MIQLDKFEGHLVLACKNWYNVKGVNMFDTLGRLHGGWCGWSAETHGNPSEATADRLYKILIKCGKDPVRLAESLHRWLVSGWWKYYNESSEWTPIEKIICFYRSEISDLQIKENNKILIKLPKPQKRAARKLIKYNKDYRTSWMDKLNSDE